MAAKVAEGWAANVRVENGEGGGGEGRWRRERRRAAAAEGGGGCEVEMARAAAARAAAVRVGGRAGRGGEGGRRRGAVAARVAEGWAAEAATAGTSTSRVDDGNSGRPRAGHGAGRRLASQSGPPRLSCDPWAPRPRPEARPTRRRCGCTPAPSGGAPQGHHLWFGFGGGGSRTYEGQLWRGSGRARTHNRRAQRLAGRSQGTSCTASSHGRMTRPGARGLETVVGG